MVPHDLGFVTYKLFVNNPKCVEFLLFMSSVSFLKILPCFVSKSIYVFCSN